MPDYPYTLVAGGSAQTLSFGQGAGFYTGAFYVKDLDTGQIYAENDQYHQNLNGWTLTLNTTSAGGYIYPASATVGVPENGTLAPCIVVVEASGNFFTTIFNVVAGAGTVTGCTVPTAQNYNPNATQEDGSCLYAVGAGTGTPANCSNTITWTTP